MSSSINKMVIVYKDQIFRDERDSEFVSMRDQIYYICHKVNMISRKKTKKNL